jgi:hypothetical protein
MITKFAFICAVLAAAASCGSERAPTSDNLFVSFDDCMAAADLATDGTVPPAPAIAADCLVLEASGHSVPDAELTSDPCGAVFDGAFDVCLAQHGVAPSGDDGASLSESDLQALAFCETQVAGPKREACIASRS